MDAVVGGEGEEAAGGTEGLQAQRGGRSAGRGRSWSERHGVCHGRRALRSSIVRLPGGGPVVRGGRPVKVVPPHGAVRSADRDDRLRDKGGAAERHMAVWAGGGGEAREGPRLQVRLRAPAVPHCAVSVGGGRGDEVAGGRDGHVAYRAGVVVEVRDEDAVGAPGRGGGAVLGGPVLGGKGRGVMVSVAGEGVVAGVVGALLLAACDMHLLR